MAHFTLITNPLTGDRLDFTSSEGTIPELIVKFVKACPKLSTYVFNNHHSIRLNKELIDLNNIAKIPLRDRDTVLMYPNIHVPVAIYAVMQAAASAAASAAGLASTIGGSAVAAGASAGAAVGTIGGTVGISAGLSSSILAASYVGAAIGTIAPMAALTAAMQLFGPNKPSMGNSDGGMGDSSPTYGWEVQQMGNEGIPVPIGYGRYKTGGNVISVSTQSKLQLSYEWTSAKDITMQGTGIPNLIAVPICPSNIPVVGAIPYVNIGLIGLWPPIRGFACTLDESIWLYTAFYFRLWSFGDLKRLIGRVVHAINEGLFPGMKNHATVFQRFMQAFSRHGFKQVLQNETKWGSGKTLIDRIRDIIGNSTEDSDAIHEYIDNNLLATVDVETDIDTDTAISDSVTSMTTVTEGEEEYYSQYNVDYTDAHLTTLGTMVKEWWNELVQDAAYTKRFTMTPLIAPGLTGGRFVHMFDSYSSSEDNMGGYLVGFVAWTPEMVTELLAGEVPVAKWYISNMNFLTWIAGELKIGDSSLPFPKISLSEEQILHQLTALGEGELSGIDKITVNNIPIDAVPGTDFVFFKGANTQRLSGSEARFVDAVRWYQKAGMEKTVSRELKDVGDSANFNSTAECNNVEIKIDFTAYHTNRKGHIEDLGDYPMRFAILTGFQDNIVMEELGINDINSLAGDFLLNNRCMARIYDFYGGTTVLCHKVYYAFELLAWITKVVEWILFYQSEGYEVDAAGRMANDLNISFDSERYESEAEYRFNIRDAIAAKGDYWTVESVLKEYNFGDRNKNVSGITAFCNMMGIEFNEQTYADPAELTYKEQMTNTIRDAMNSLFIGVGKKLTVKVVRLTKIDDDAHPTYTDNMYVKSFTEVTYSAYDYPNTALGALAIRATNEFNSSPPEVLYNIKARKIRTPKLFLASDGTTRVRREFSWFDEDINAYRSTMASGAVCVEDTTDWGYEFCDNPVWCLYDLLINRRFGLGNYINQADTDIGQFIDMAHYCDQMVPDGINRTATSISVSEIDDGDPDLFKMVRAVYFKEDDDLEGNEPGDFRQINSGAWNWFDYKKHISGEALFSKNVDGNWTKSVIETCRRTIPISVFKNAKFSLKSDAYAEATSPYWTNGEPSSGYSTKYYQLGQKRFRLDINIDERSPAPDIIKTICDTFRCAPVWINGTVFPIIDRWEYPVAVIGMGNIIKDSFSLSYTPLSKTPNVLECQFSNEDLDFQKDTRVKIASNVDLAYSSDITKTIRRESAKLIGITRVSQLERELTYRLNSYQERIKVITFEMGIEHITFHAGQVIAFTHDILTLGSYSGRIVDYVAADSDSGTIYLDQELVKPGGETWKIQITQIVQDEIIATDYYEIVGEFSVVSVSGNSISVSGLNGFVPKPFDNYAIGQEENVTENYKILSIQPKGTGEAEINAVNWGRETISGNITTHSVFGNLRQVSPWDTGSDPQYVTYDDYLVDSRESSVIEALVPWGPNPVQSPLGLTELAGEVGIRLEFGLPTGHILNGYDHAIVSLAIGDSTDYQQVCEIRTPGTMARITKAMGAVMGVVNKVQVRAVYDSGAISSAVDGQLTVTGASTSLGFNPPTPVNLRLSRLCKRHPLSLDEGEARELGADFIEIVWDRANASNVFGANSWLIDPKERFIKEYEVAVYRSDNPDAYLASGHADWDTLPSGEGIHYVSNTQNRFKVKLEELGDVDEPASGQYNVLNYPYYKFEVRSLTDSLHASEPAILMCSYPEPGDVVLPWHFRIPLVDAVFVRWHYPQWWSSIDHYELDFQYIGSRDGWSGICSGQETAVTTDGNFPMLFHKFDASTIDMYDDGVLIGSLQDNKLDPDVFPFVIRTQIHAVDKFGRRQGSFITTDAEDVYVGSVGSGQIDDDPPTWYDNDPNLHYITTIQNKYLFTRFCKAKVSFNKAVDATTILLSYKVAHRVYNDAEDDKWIENSYLDSLIRDGNTCTCLIPALEVGRDYEWKVKAVDRFGNETGWAEPVSPEPAFFNTVPDDDPPGQITLGSSTDCKHDVEAESLGVSSTIYIPVLKTSVSDDCWKFRVNYKRNIGEWVLFKYLEAELNDCKINPDTGLESITAYWYIPVKDLIPETQYKFRVKQVDFANNPSDDWSTPNLVVTSSTVETIPPTISTAVMVPLFTIFHKWNVYRIVVNMTLSSTYDYIRTFTFKITPSSGNPYFHTITDEGTLDGSNYKFEFFLPVRGKVTVPYNIGTDTGWDIQVQSWANAKPSAFSTPATSVLFGSVSNSTAPDIDTVTPKQTMWRFVSVQPFQDGYDFPDNFSHFTIHACYGDVDLTDAENQRKTLVNTGVNPYRDIKVIFVPYFLWDGDRRIFVGNMKDTNIKIKVCVWQFPGDTANVPTLSKVSAATAVGETTDDLDIFNDSFFIKKRSISVFGGDALYAPSGRYLYTAPLDGKFVIDRGGADSIFSVGDILIVGKTDRTLGFAGAEEFNYDKDAEYIKVTGVETFALIFEKLTVSRAQYGTSADTLVDGDILIKVGHVSSDYSFVWFDAANATMKVVKTTQAGSTFTNQMVSSFGPGNIHTWYLSSAYIETGRGVGEGVGKPGVLIKQEGIYGFGPDGPFPTFTIDASTGLATFSNGSGDGGHKIEGTVDVEDDGIIAVKTPDGVDVQVEGGLNLGIAGAATINVAGALDLAVAGACNVSIAGGLAVNVAGGLDLAVAGAATIDVEGALKVNVEKGLDLAVGRACNITVAGALQVSAGGSIIVDGGAINLNSSGSIAVNAAAGISIESGGSALVKAGGSLTFEANTTITNSGSNWTFISSSGTNGFVRFAKSTDAETKASFYFDLANSRLQVGSTLYANSAVVIEGGEYLSYIQVGLPEQDGRIMIDGTMGNIRSSNFVTGYSGKGFSLRTDGSAEFSNISIRGSIKAATLAYQEVQAVGGILQVTDSSCMMMEMPNITYPTLLVTEGDVFSVNEFLLCQAPSKIEVLKVLKIYTGTKPVKATALHHNFSESGLTGWTTDCIIGNLTVEGVAINGLYANPVSNVSYKYASRLVYSTDTWRGVTFGFGTTTYSAYNSGSCSFEVSVTTKDVNGVLRNFYLMIYNGGLYRCNGSSTEKIADLVLTNNIYQITVILDCSNCLASVIVNGNSMASDVDYSDTTPSTADGLIELITWRFGDVTNSIVPYVIVGSAFQETGCGNYLVSRNGDSATASWPIRTPVVSRGIVSGDGWITLDASTAGYAPYMSVVSRTGSSYSQTATKVVLGNLAGVGDILSTWGVASPGFGLYTDNCFLKGSIYLGAGKDITLIPGVYGDAAEIIFTGLATIYGRNDNVLRIMPNTDASGKTLHLGYCAAGDKYRWDSIYGNVTTSFYFGIGDSTSPPHNTLELTATGFLHRLGYNPSSGVFNRIWMGGTSSYIAIDFKAPYDFGVPSGTPYNYNWPCMYIGNWWSSPGVIGGYHTRLNWSDVWESGTKTRYLLLNTDGVYLSNAANNSLTITSTVLGLNFSSSAYLSIISSALTLQSSSGVLLYQSSTDCFFQRNANSKVFFNSSLAGLNMDANNFIQLSATEVYWRVNNVDRIYMSVNDTNFISPRNTYVRASADNNGYALRLGGSGDASYRFTYTVLQAYNTVWIMAGSTAYMAVNSSGVTILSKLKIPVGSEF